MRFRAGQKKLKEGKVEFYDRATRQPKNVELTDAANLAVQRIKEAVQKLNDADAI